MSFYRLARSILNNLYHAKTPRGMGCETPKSFYQERLFLTIISLHEQVIVQFYYAVAEGEAFLLYGFADLTHAVRSHLEKKRARVYEDSLSHYML